MGTQGSYPTPAAPSNPSSTSALWRCELYVMSLLGRSGAISRKAR